MKKMVIVAGMPRAGTTWLYYNLVKHPQAAMPKFKETFFFGSNFKRGFEWYYSLYSEHDIDNKVAFDISPNYYLDPNFFKNVSQFDVDHKVVLILREPAEWVSSLYSQFKSFTPNMPSVEDYLQKFQIDFDGGKQIINLNDFDFSGVVEKFINRYHGKLLLINFDEIKTNPIRVLNEIEKFAGIDAYFDPSSAYVKPVNVSIPKFDIIAYLSTKPLLRKLVRAYVPSPVRDKLIDYLYKVGKETDVKNMPDKVVLENKFKPLYVEEYFKKENILHL